MFDYINENKDVPILKLPIGLDIPVIECITKVSSLAWDEHCLECAAPECHKTCPLFKENRYKKCQRTEYGIRRVYYTDKGLYNYGVQLKYRKWGKLRCHYNNNIILDPIIFKRYFSIYEKCRNLMKVIGSPLDMINTVPKDLLPRAMHHILVKNHKYNNKNVNIHIDGILFSCYSHLSHEYSMIFDTLKDNRVISRLSLLIKQGMNNYFMTVAQLKILSNNITAIEVYPENNKEVELTIFWLDLIKLNQMSKYFKEHKSLFSSIKPYNKVKCVVWDLDNTLWEGTLVEDGKENLKLRTSAVELIKKLDERGILLSIASKNDHHNAETVIRKYGLQEYFLYPQINWMPKSKNLQKIVEKLNINIDTVAFIDDSAMERNEVKGIFPSVRVYSEKQITELLTFDEFNVIVTEDSKNRRKFYQNEMKRNKEKEEISTSEYVEFLKKCEIVVTIFKPKTENEVNRCLELIQRTNQLNASSRRLTENEFRNILVDPEQTVLAMKCEDRFGEYGTVGCLILRSKDYIILVTDFVLSCRVAAKKVENAISKKLFETCGNACENTLLKVKFVQTERNHVISKVFEEMGGVYNTQDSVFLIEEDKIIDYDIVTVRLEENNKVQLGG